MVEGSLLFSLDFFLNEQSSCDLISESNKTAEDRKACNLETNFRYADNRSFYFTFPPAADYNNTFESSFSTTDCQTIDQ